MDTTPRRDPARSERRDDDIRAVSKTTKAVVAAAVIGVGAFAGLAATGQTSASSALGRGGSSRDGGSAPAARDETPAAASPTYDDAYSYEYTDDGRIIAVPSDQGFSAPQSAPSFSQGPPVGGSGGS